MNSKETYLGDGLYAVYDGYHIELRAHDMNNPTDRVYLDDKVLANFEQFVKSIRELNNE